MIEFPNSLPPQPKTISHKNLEFKPIAEIAKKHIRDKTPLSKKTTIKRNITQSNSTKTLPLTKELASNPTKPAIIIHDTSGKLTFESPQKMLEYYIENQIGILANPK